MNAPYGFDPSANPYGQPGQFPPAYGAPNSYGPPTLGVPPGYPPGYPQAYPPGYPQPPKNSGAKVALIVGAAVLAVIAVLGIVIFAVRSEDSKEDSAQSPGSTSSNTGSSSTQKSNSRSPSTAENNFLVAVKTLLDVHDRDDQELLDEGYAACDVVAALPSDEIDALQKFPLDKLPIAALAVGSLCPQFISKIGSPGPQPS